MTSGISDADKVNEKLITLRLRGEMKERVLNVKLEIRALVGEETMTVPVNVVFLRHSDD
ncbi:MAG: hypothetical protein JW955_13085 [Sedimentisphaerales bacterium]|nr:hypothetical protein [Sedimentisphaerales bacterium]